MRSAPTSPVFSFASVPAARVPEPLFPGALYLPAFADSAALLPHVAAVASAAPFRQMETPFGRMRAALTACGAWGWVSDRRGYRYTREDPESGRPWPPLPTPFAALAARAAEAAGFPGFVPDSCIVNRYSVGTGMGSHQDRDERDLGQPVVSVSLGLPIRFFFQRPKAPAGLEAIRTQSFILRDSDVLVWGGPARLLHHGVRPLPAGVHPLTGGYRYNLTLRVAG